MNFFVRNETCQSFIDTFSLRTWYAIALLCTTLTGGVWWYALYVPLKNSILWYIHENSTLTNRMVHLKQKQRHKDDNNQQESIIQCTTPLALILEEQKLTPKRYTENSQHISITFENSFLITMSFLEKLMHHKSYIIEQCSLEKGTVKNSIVMHCTLKKLIPLTTDKE